MLSDDPTASPASGAPAVLLVDDEPDLLELLTYSLEGAGFAVRTASDGAAALASALAEPPDVFVLDIMMPRMDGLALTETRTSLPAQRRSSTASRSSEPLARNIVSGPCQ